MVHALRSFCSALYSATVDRSMFREVVTRYVVFVLPIVFWGRKPWWAGMWIVATGVLVRAWAAGHLRKDQELAQGGPYLLVRHPLYVGSCLLALGLIVCFHHWAVTLVLGALTAMTYVHQIRHEEGNLRRQFGARYAEYSRRAGPLWPRVAGLRAFFRGRRARRAPSWRQYMRNREYECLLGVLAVFALLWLGSRGAAPLNFEAIF